MMSQLSFNIKKVIFFLSLFAINKATQAQTDNADLSALTISAGTLSPTFASGTIAYTASVNNATTSITVTPTKIDANATIQAQVNGGGYATVTSGSASGSLALNEGSNTVNFGVYKKSIIQTTKLWLHTLKFCGFKN